MCFVCLWLFLGVVVFGRRVLFSVGGALFVCVCSKPFVFNVFRLFVVVANCLFCCWFGLTCFLCVLFVRFCCCLKLCFCCVVLFCYF